MRNILLKVFLIISFPFKVLLFLPFKILAYFFDAVERFKQEQDKKKQWMKDLEKEKRLRCNKYRKTKFNSG